jgi:hypothetical protein
MLKITRTDTQREVVDHVELHGTQGRCIADGGLFMEPDGVRIDIGAGFVPGQRFEPQVTIEFSKDILAWMLPHLIRKAGEQGIVLNLRDIVR